MKTKNSLARRMLMSIVAVVMTMMTLTSCSEFDNSIVYGPDIVGWWYTEYNQKGAFGDEEENHYYKVAQAACFNEDGTGLWVEVYLNTAEDMIMPEGRLASFAAHFDYTVAPDGTVSFDITDLKPIDISDLKPDKWTMKFNGKEIIGKEAGTDFTLEPITAEQQQRLNEWTKWLIGGDDSDSTLSKYNINSDTSLPKITPFTRDNWDEKKSIIIRTAYSIDDDIVDANGKKGYRSIILPWAKEADGTPITSLSQLPNHFCDDVNRASGWDLVANFCGRFSLLDANYIALYNRYTGILRYFYYIPEGTNLNNTNDHNWEIQMNDGAADHAVFGYALPIDKKLTVQNATKIGARNAGYWSQFVTPWAATSDKLGNVTPHAGWYAFDVDLSVYRGEESTISNKETIRPLLRGYAKDNTTLYGNIDADITGNINMEKCCVNTTNGVFGPLEDVLGNIKDIKDFIGDAKEVYGKVMSGDILGAIEGGINVAKKGCDIAGIDYGKEGQGFDGYKGTVNMKLSGTINMKGAIEGSRVISAPNGFLQSFGDFEFGDTHFGEGVWNLDVSPVVYYTNAQISWREEYKAHSWNSLWDAGTIYDITWTGKDSPFGGRKSVVYPDMGDTKVITSKEPWCGYVTYFDPSSIKVVLNPHLFTQKEIESAQVYATCGVRKKYSSFGSLDNYRDAFGYNEKGSKFDIDLNNGGNYTNRPHSEAPFDALNNSEDKHNMKTVAKFPTSTFDGHSCGMFGRGDTDYILEPQALSGDDHPLRTYMPSYEVTVTVIVMHDEKPIVYSRTYLPEYKEMKVADMPNPTDKYIEESRPANYAPAVYAQQMGHYRDVYNWTRRTLQVLEGPDLGYPVDYYITVDTDYESATDSWPNAIDGDLNTKWCTYKATREYKSWISPRDDGQVCWWSIYQTNYPVSPTGYTFFNGNNTKTYTERRPRVWYIWGSKNGHDWVKLAYEFTSNSDGSAKPSAMPTGNFEAKSYKFNEGKAQDFQYYMLEITSNWSSDNMSEMQISEFRLDYDD